MFDSKTEDLCWKIVTAIAEERGIEQHAIEERVQDVIDIDSLEQLARQSGESKSIELSVSFQIAGCFVTVTDGGRVRASCPGTRDTDISTGNRCLN
jgi:hypothetical protein